MWCLTYWLALCLLCYDVQGYGQQRQESFQVEFPDYGQSRQESYGSSLEYDISNTCATKDSVEEVVSSVSSLTTSISSKLDQVNEAVQAECDTKTVIKIILSALQSSMSAQIEELKASFAAVATKTDLQNIYSKQVEMSLAQVATDDQVANSTMMLQMEFQMIKDQMTYKDDFQLVKDAVETSTSTLEYELNLVKRELADLKKSCNGGKVVDRKVCTHGNETYHVGSFNIGCQERCECFSNGTMICQERCSPPYFSVGSFSHDSLCTETPSDSDRCCVTASCTSSRSSSKIHLNDSNIVEHGGFRPGGAGPENLLHDNGFWNPNPPPWYVVFDFHHRFAVEGLSLSNFGDVTHDVAEFTLETADNVTINTEYRLVTKATNVGKGTNEPQLFTFTPATGRFWRFNVTKVYSEFQPWIEELIFHGYQATALTCPPQFSPVGLQCLRVVLGGLLKDKTWRQAQEECQRLGGTLAQLQDTNPIVQHIGTDLGRENWKFWVGASWNSENETFRWTASGAGVGNWDEGQPDNGGFKLFDHSDEHCVELQAWNGKYNDQDCDEKRSFVCQADPLEETPSSTSFEPVAQQETLDQTEQALNEVDTGNHEQQEQSNTEHGRNCEQIRRSLLRDYEGDPVSMVREIYPFGDAKNRSVQVYCDEKPRQGGWTVIQHRMEVLPEYLKDFNKHWQEYKDGFGEPYRDHWLGLDAISALTNQGPTELLIILEDFEGVRRFAHYDQFRVHNESTGYKMEVSGYSGDAGDSFSHHSGQQFTTTDVDNDSWDSGNCAYNFGGAWWHKSCHECNLNGRYLHGVHDSYADGINWKAWHGYHYSLKTTKMMIRPRRYVKKRVKNTPVRRINRS